MNTTADTPNQAGDPSLSVHADALAKAALQATCRAMHIAGLATAAYRHAPRNGQTTYTARLKAARRADILNNLRDAITDAYAAIPNTDRDAIRRCPANMDSDQLLDLLALLVRG